VSSEATRVLVLGMDGMLGHTLVSVLSAAEGFEVRGTRRPGRPGAIALDAEQGTLPLRRALAAFGPPGLVVNAIGIRADRIREDEPDSVRRAHEVNARFPLALANVAEELGLRVLHVSTDGVFAANAGRCFEDTAASASDVYGRSKSLGEAVSPRVVNVRCSLVGPDGAGGRGLFEWFRRQPRGARVRGFTDQIWNGVTTVQLAELSRLLAEPERFDAVRAEGPVHHFCPNRTVTKHDLLLLFRDALGADTDVVADTSRAPSNRELRTNLRSLTSLLGADQPMETAIRRMVMELGGAL
jgi:dTDP-4-dehydrorhamnose reductase